MAHLLLIDIHMTVENDMTVENEVSIVAYYFIMTEVSFDHDPTQLILSQLKSPTPRYLHQDYLARQLLQFNPEEVDRYEKPLE